MIWAVWVTAISGAVTAAVSLAGQIQHRRHDNRRFADLDQRIGNGPS
jgi:hypothetical protein